MTFSISARISSRDAVEGLYGSRDDSRDDNYGKGHVLIILSYTSDKLFYEANEQNEIIKWILMEV
jgi:hypothetical protein